MARDTIVFPVAAEKIHEYYQSFVEDATDTELNMENPAWHAVVSDHVGTSCGTSDFRLYIEDCDFDSVFGVINFVNGGDLDPPLEPGTANGRLAVFDQEEFMDGVPAYNASMESYGYVYIPERCEPGTGITCRLHMFFHGCTMQARLPDGKT